MSFDPKLIAFYLPQFHPVPENDAWWGKGFTEWTNVTKTRPLFKGHYQPHLPADLGFCDLRLPEVRAAQAELAREYRIHGFCYYHYWFKGRRILERPFNEVLKSGEPDFPFCLCWANQTWSRRWDGSDREILLEQNYSQEDDHDHMRWLCNVLADERNIRVDGKPLLAIYLASILPDASRTVDTWREIALKEGVGEIFLCNVDQSNNELNGPDRWGFDASIQFAPDWDKLGVYEYRGIRSLLKSLVTQNPACFQNHIHDYRVMVSNMQAAPRPSYLRFPCVTPMWDNHARRKKGAIVLVNSTPELYEKWLRETLNALRDRPTEHQICFINAWNEWAEGCHLEPCQKWGRQFLEATKRALCNGSQPLDGSQTCDNSPGEKAILQTR